MMQKSSKFEPEINWTKADKPFPKKSATLSSYFISNQNKQIDSNGVNSCSTKAYNPFNLSRDQFRFDQIENQQNDSSSIRSSNRCSPTPEKVTIKDLCNEDKQRIANLIKELAKIGEEKQSLEKALEEERKQREKEISDVLKQQELLLQEKEKLIRKFAKTQEKLIELKKNNKKLNSNEINDTNKSESKSAVLINVLTSSKSKNNEISNSQNQNASDNKHNSNENENDNENLFNPHKSSTPKNLSPRGISPILINNQKPTDSNREDLLNQKTTKLIQNSIDVNDEMKNRQSTLNNVHGDDLKRIELLKQQMELVDEQKQLRILLDQQEEMLKEKQAQIMLQQKLHRERLEELNKLKSIDIESINNQNKNYDLTNQHVYSAHPDQLNLNSQFMNGPAVMYPMEHLATIEPSQYPIHNITNPNVLVKYNPTNETLIQNHLPYFIQSPQGFISIQNRVPNMNPLPANNYQQNYLESAQLPNIDDLASQVLKQLMIKKELESNQNLKQQDAHQQQQQQQEILIQKNNLKFNNSIESCSSLDSKQENNDLLYEFLNNNNNNNKNGQKHKHQPNPVGFIQTHSKSEKLNKVSTNSSFPIQFAKQNVNKLNSRQQINQKETPNKRLGVDHDAAAEESKLLEELFFL